MELFQAPLDTGGATVQVGDWSARVWADDVLGSSLITINTGTELLTGEH